MQMQPSANRPSANTSPPSITRNRAMAIAGTAASTRALRSERCPPVDGPLAEGLRLADDLAVDARPGERSPRVERRIWGADEAPREAPADVWGRSAIALLSVRRSADGALRTRPGTVRARHTLSPARARLGRSARYA